MERGREEGREGGREGGRQGGREGGREGGRRLPMLFRKGEGNSLESVFLSNVCRSSEVSSDFSGRETEKDTWHSARFTSRAKLSELLIAKQLET